MSSDPTKDVPEWEQTMLKVTQLSTSLLGKENFTKSEKPYTSHTPTNTATITFTTAAPVPDEYRDQLKEIWRVSLPDLKATIDEFIENVHSILNTSLGKDTMMSEVDGTSDKTAVALETALNEVAGTAISFLRTIPGSRRQAAADYWFTLSVKILGFLSMASGAVGASIEEINGSVSRIREVEGRIQSEADRAYAAAFWLSE